MKKERGITLIALVVTIIILIVLSAITFSIILGENGVIDKAKEASKDMDIKTAEEKLILEKGGLAVEKKGGKISVDEYVNYIANRGIIDPSQNGVEPNGSVSIIVDTHEFLVSQITEHDIKIEYMGLAEDRDRTEPNEASIIITGSKEQATLPINIGVEVEHIDDQSGVSIEKCKWVYNTIAEEIGTDESLYTEEFTTNPQEMPLNIEEEGEYYLHILTIDNRGNKKETIEGPITVNANYHTHEGSTASGGACYATPVYHTHTGNSSSGGGCYGQKNTKTEQHSANWVNKHTHGNSYTGVPDTCYDCSKCGACSLDKGLCKWTTTTVTYSINCNKAAGAIEKYNLSCTKTGDIIDNYTVQY